MPVITTILKPDHILKSAFYLGTLLFWAPCGQWGVSTPANLLAAHLLFLKHKVCTTCMRATDRGLAGLERERHIFGERGRDCKGQIKNERRQVERGRKKEKHEERSQRRGREESLGLLSTSRCFRRVRQELFHHLHIWSSSFAPPCLHLPTSPPPPLLFLSNFPSWCICRCAFYLKRFFVVVYAWIKLLLHCCGIPISSTFSLLFKWRSWVKS